MREYKCTIGGKELKLVANFAASQRIAKEVADPLMISREAFVEAMMISANMSYEPKWSFDVDNIWRLVLIGVEAGGDSIDKQQLQELIFEEGFFNVRRMAEEYLALIVGPTPEELDTNSAESKAEGNLVGSTS